MPKTCSVHCSVPRAVLFALLVSGQARAQTFRVLTTRGKCELQRGALPWGALSPGATLVPEDQVRTGHGSTLTLALPDGTRNWVGPDTLLRLSPQATPRTQNLGRRLVDLVRGRIRLHAKPQGAQPPLTITTPTAMAGVRGTDFYVLADAERSTIGVAEGVVSVANLDLQAQPVTVNAGEKTVVFAGQPPLPPMPLTAGDQREARGEAAALDRLEDAAVEETEQLPVERFLAFADVHVDAVRNPAYAAAVDAPTTQVFGLAGLASHDRLKTPTAFTVAGAAVTGVTQRREESGNDYAGWGATFHPTGPDRVLGGFASYQRLHHWDTADFAGTATVSGAATPFTQVGTPGTPASDTRFAALDLGLVGARRLPSLDAGLLVHYRESSSRGASRYERIAAGLAPDSEYSLGRGESDLAEIVAGIASTDRRGTEWSWAVGYRDASTDLRDRAHTLDGAPSPLATVHEDFNGWHTEFRARRRLSAEWGWGASLRAVLLDGRAQYADSTGLPFAESITDRFYRLGVGVGYAPTPRTALGFDLVGGIRREEVLQRYLSGNAKEAERERNPSLALHLGGQHWLDDRSFLSLDVTHVRQRRHLDFVFFPDVAGSASNGAQHVRQTLRLSEWSLGYGRRLGPQTTLEYLLTDPLAQGQGSQHRLVMSWRR
jgi:hypothetical protein